MKYPMENNNSGSSSKQPQNMSQYHQKQDVGVRITNPNRNLEFINSVQHTGTVDGSDSSSNKPEIISLVDTSEEAGFPILPNPNVFHSDNSNNHVSSMVVTDPPRNLHASAPPLHQNQEVGYGHAPSLDLSSFCDLVSDMGNISEDGQARAQNMSSTNFMHPAMYPLMTRNNVGSFQTHVHPVMVSNLNINHNSAQFNRPQRPQTDRSFLHVGPNTPDGFQQNIQWNGMGYGTNLRPDTPMPTDMYRSMVGINSNTMPQYPYQQEQMVPNQVPNSVRSNYPFFLEALRRRNAMTQSHGLVAPQVDGNSLSLGGNFRHSNVRTNNTANLFGSNISTNLISPGVLQTSEVNGQHCYPIQSGQVLGTGGIMSSRYMNIDPNRGSHGYSTEPSRQSGDIRAALLNEQIMRTRMARVSRTGTQIPNERGLTELQQAWRDNPSSTLSGISPSAGTITSSRSHSGPSRQPINVAISQDAGNLTTIASKREHIQPATRGTQHVSGKGKRSPAQGSQHPQSSKVLLGPSVTTGIGKPVPIAARSLLKSVVHGREQNVSASRLKQPISAVSGPPTQRRTAQHSKISSLPSEHIRWKGLDSFASRAVEENCAICKRNLTFTPTGPVSQPSIPPEVAVLPCRHTFHDECLQKITPPEESKNPSCIPCALGIP